MDEHGIPTPRGGGVEEGAGRAALGGGGDRVGREGLVVMREVGVEVLGGGEAVDEGAFAAVERGGLEAVEELEAGGVGEVGVVGVGGEVVVCVGGVDGVGVGGEVPEAAVVGGADVGDAFDEGLGGLRVGGGSGDEAEA